MKTISNQLMLGIMAVMSILGYAISCTHKDVVVPAPATNTITILRGTNVHKPGTITAGDTTQWKLDKVHSNVMWSTNYMAAAGLLTGRFNQFGMHNVTTDKMLTYTTTGQALKDTSWAFDEANPTNTYFSGYVQINTSNTGEPGRDAGCNISALGTTPIVAGVQNLSVTNIAKIQTTKIEFDPASSDYIVYFNLTWKGTTADPISKALVGKLKYIKRAVVGAGTTSSYSVFGLQLAFQFNCRDFGIASTSIADKINIECNMNFNNK